MRVALISENHFQMLRFYEWFFKILFSKSVNLTTFKVVVLNSDDSTEHLQEYIICFNKIILPVIVSNLWKWKTKTHLNYNVLIKNTYS